MAQRFANQIEVRWDDIRNEAEVRAAIEGQDMIVYLAALIPPVSVEQPELAEQVNVGGTRNLIDAAKAQPKPPKFFFTSSFDLFGYTQDQHTSAGFALSSAVSLVCSSLPLEPALDSSLIAQCHQLQQRMTLCLIRSAEHGALLTPKKTGS